MFDMGVSGVGPVKKITEMANVMTTAERGDSAAHHACSVDVLQGWACVCSQHPASMHRANISDELRKHVCFHVRHVTSGLAWVF